MQRIPDLSAAIEVDSDWLTVMFEYNIRGFGVVMDNTGGVKMMNAS